LNPIRKFVCIAADEEKKTDENKSEDKQEEKEVKGKVFNNSTQLNST